jgi:large subunit ribosomal protein L20
MPRVRKGAACTRKHKRLLKQAKGFHGSASRRYRVAREKTFRAGVYATRDRRRRKRDFRRLWIVRISAACRQRGLRYNQLIEGLFAKDILLNRKMLAEIAVADPTAFDAVVQACGLEAVRQAG